MMPASPIRRYVGWVIDCLFLLVIGPLTAFVVWALTPMAEPPPQPACDLRCVDHLLRETLAPYATAEQVASGGANIILNSSAWIRHFANLFLYALTLVSFLAVGFILGAIGYIIWWSILLHRGQTPGKQLVGIRAVRQDGTPVDWGTMFVREGVKTVLYLIPLGILFDFFVMMSDIDRPYSLADRFTGTMIVR